MKYSFSDYIKVAQGFGFAFFLHIFFATTLSAQMPEWSIDFRGIVDNREYFNPYTEDGTIAATRISPTLTFPIYDKHQLVLGASWLYEFGAPVYEHLPIATAYYSYSDSLLDFKIGTFPRKDILNYPQVLLIDTIGYFSPNIDGAFIQLKLKRGNQYVWLDWVNKIDYGVSERFLAGTSGRFEFGSYFFENYMYMYHKGNDLERSRPIRDNAGSSFFIGKEFDTKIDFKFKAGYVGSYNRMRPSPFRIAYGAIAEANLKYKIFGSDFVFYIGQRHLLKYGDWMYRAGRYARADFYAVPFDSEKIKLKFNIALHQLDNFLDISYLILLDLKLNGNFVKINK